MPYCTNVGFILNDDPTTNVLMHIIIYSTVYEKKKKKVFVFVSVALAFTFILVLKLQLDC